MNDTTILILTAMLVGIGIGYMTCYYLTFLIYLKRMGDGELFVFNKKEGKWHPHNPRDGYKLDKPDRSLE
jgi:hypothetical protein